MFLRIKTSITNSYLIATLKLAACKFEENPDVNLKQQWLVLLNLQGS